MNRISYKFELVFNDTTARNIAITSDGQSQHTGIISPENITNITVTELIITGEAIKKIDDMYDFIQQCAPAEIAYGIGSSNFYGKTSHTILRTGMKANGGVSEIYISNYTDAFAPGTRLRVWGD